MDSPILIPLRPTRLLKARLAVNHAWTGVALLVTGALALLGHEAHGWHLVVAVLAVLSGGAVLLAIRNELVHDDAHHRATVRWVELLAGVMLMVEGLEHLRFTKWFQPAIFYFAAGAFTVWIGLDHQRFADRRGLRLDARGLKARLSLFRRVSATWRELESLGVAGDDLVLTLAGGRTRRLSLAMIANRNEAMAALRLHAARHGVPAAALPPAAARVQDALRARGSAARVVTLEEPGHTAPEAARVLGCEVARIVKSLVFRGASGRALLVLASGANRVDESRLAALAGEPVGRADADFVRARAGFAIGGVPPLGHPEPLPTWIDADLLAHDTVWAAGGAPEAFVRLEPAELARLTGGTVAAIH